jgi:hypothetical protein
LPNVGFVNFRFFVDVNLCIDLGFLLVLNDFRNEILVGIVRDVVSVNFFGKLKYFKKEHNEDNE